LINFAAVSVGWISAGARKSPSDNNVKNIGSNVKIENTIPKIPSATIIALRGLVVGSNKSSELLEDNDGVILLLNSFWSVMIFTLINELNKSLIIWHKLQLSA
jgi:hypothetical protein